MALAPTLPPTAAPATPAPVPPRLSELEREYDAMMRNPTLMASYKSHTGREPVSRDAVRDHIKGESGSLFNALMSPTAGRKFALLAQAALDEFKPDADKFKGKNATEDRQFESAKIEVEKMYSFNGIDKPHERGMAAEVMRQLYNDFATRAKASDEKNERKHFTDADGKMVIPENLQAPSGLTDNLRAGQAARKGEKAKFAICLERELDPMTGAPIHSIVRRELPGYKHILAHAHAGALKESSSEAMIGHFIGSSLAGLWGKHVTQRPYSNAINHAEATRLKMMGAVARQKGIKQTGVGSRQRFNHGRTGMPGGGAGGGVTAPSMAHATQRSSMTPGGGTVISPSHGHDEEPPGGSGHEEMPEDVMAHLNGEMAGGHEEHSSYSEEPPIEMRGEPEHFGVSEPEHFVDSEPMPPAIAPEPVVRPHVASLPPPPPPSCEFPTEDGNTFDPI